MEKAIIIEGLTKKYKNSRGIVDVSLMVERGDIFGFLGPNGAGKTTAMKIMTGLMRPDSGRVLINGFDVQTDCVRAMDGVGCIVESVTPFPYLTAIENLSLVARLHPGIGGDQIDSALEQVGILKYGGEKIKNFSLGMKQRLGIAMAIVSDPDILILDEPLNGLDVEGMVEMRKLFLNLAQERGKTLFISSHLIHDIELTCNKIGILYNGRQISVETTENILKNYSSLENYYLSEVDSDARA